ncbi:MAG: (2Fe-2S) ferredoxin domain-containing protein [Chryseobacterium sp.]|nr:MAG: (2Fe-2S) ferredoxin domain-containing protein [Chryseobacterium sp.]
MKRIEAPEKIVFICDGKKCGQYSKEVRKGFKAAAKEIGMKNILGIARMDCTDNCKHAPVVTIQPNNVWMGEVSGGDVPDIFSRYIL